VAGADACVRHRTVTAHGQAYPLRGRVGDEQQHLARRLAKQPLARPGGHGNGGQRQAVDTALDAQRAGLCAHAARTAAAGGAGDQRTQGGTVAVDAGADRATGAHQPVACGEQRARGAVGVLDRGPGIEHEDGAADAIERVFAGIAANERIASTISPLPRFAQTCAMPGRIRRARADPPAFDYVFATTAAIGFSLTINWNTSGRL